MLLERNLFFVGSPASAIARVELNERRLATARMLRW
jgi:hypothetical protein